MNLYNPFDPAARPIAPYAIAGGDPRSRPQTLPPGWHLDVMTTGPLSSSQWIHPAGYATRLIPHRITARHYHFEFQFPTELAETRNANLSGGEIAFSFGAAIVERLPFNAPLDEVEQAIAAAGKAAGFGPVQASALRTRGQGLDIRFRIPGFPEFNFPPLEMFSSCTAGGTAVASTVCGGHTLAWVGHYGRFPPIPPDAPASIRPQLAEVLRDQTTSGGTSLNLAAVPRWISQPVYDFGTLTSPEHWFFGLNLPYVYWNPDSTWARNTLSSWGLALTPLYTDDLEDYEETDDITYAIAPFEAQYWNGQTLTVGPRIHHAELMGPPPIVAYHELPDFLTLRPLYSFAMDAKPDDFSLPSL